jgi:hypothetical protein
MRGARRRHVLRDAERHPLQAVIGVVGRHRRADRQLIEPAALIVAVVVGDGSPHVRDDIAGTVVGDGADRGGRLRRLCHGARTIMCFNLKSLLYFCLQTRACRPKDNSECSVVPYRVLSNMGGISGSVSVLGKSTQPLLVVARRGVASERDGSRDSLPPARALD